MSNYAKKIPCVFISYITFFALRIIWFLRRLTVCSFNTVALYCCAEQIAEIVPYTVEGTSCTEIFKQFSWKGVYVGALWEKLKGLAWISVIKTNKNRTCCHILYVYTSTTTNSECENLNFQYKHSCHTVLKVNKCSSFYLRSLLILTDLNSLWF